MLLTYQAKDGSMKTLRVKPISHGTPITIGRSKEADITIDDPKASRVNTAIRFWDDIFVVRDMNSRNGTYVNGTQIEVSKIKDGDVVKVGDTEFHAAGEKGTASADATIATQTG
jgi:pSer/pThr/pTyr-binding forkhead associated (FHA) protein